MTKKLKWLERSLFYGPYLVLVTSQEEFDAVLRHLKITDTDAWLEKNCQACVHTFRKEGNLTCVVALSPTAFTADPLMAIGTLIHEATHVWQRTEELHSLGEPQGRFGTESEAYAVENIAMQLILEFKRRWEAGDVKSPD